MSTDKVRVEWVEALKAKKRESEKNESTVFWLSLLLGPFGADRFYLGSIDMGLWKLVSLGGIGFWWITDLALLLLGRMRDSEGATVKRPF
jgi:TM2 domain-containing membrane protein YozV